MFYIIFIVGLLLSLSSKKRITTKLYAVIIALLAMFRYGCGADYFSYEYLYSMIHPSIIEEFYFPSAQQETGFRLIGAFCKQFNLSYQVYIAFLAIISIYFIYKISVKYSTNPTLALVVYFTCYYFFWTYSAIRQGIVMSIGIYYLLEAVKEQKVRKFFIITILLSFIHISSVFLIVLYLASRLKLGKNQLIILSILGIMVSILPLGSLIIDLSNIIPILKRVTYYVSASTSFNNIFDFQTIGRFIFLIFAFVFYDYYSESNPTNRRIINMYIISFVIYFMLKFSEMTAARLAVYGKMLDILILPNIIYMIRSKWNRSLYVTGLVMLLLVYMFKDLKSMEVYSGLVDIKSIITPYVNVFNKGKYVFYNEHLYNIIK